MKRRTRIAVRTLLGVIGVWMLGDLIYSRLIAYQVASWEATVQRDADGVWQGCAAYDVDADEPNSTALLLVHGINATPRHYQKMAARLAELGYSCRVMRLPGFAEPIDRYGESTRRDWAAAIRRELDALEKSYERVGVVAHSLGAAATLGVLIEDPQAADFAALLAPATAVASDRSPLLSTRAWHEIGRRLLVFTTVVRSPFGIDSHDPANREFPGRAPFTPRALFNELYDQMDANWRDVKQFQTPLLMVLTKDDLVIDWREAERFYHETNSATKELQFLSDSGHAIPLDYGWADTAAAIDRFSQASRGRQSAVGVVDKSTGD